MKQLIEPLKTLESVLSWRPTQEDELACGTVKLAKITKRDLNARRTLICHDMQGGYVQDRFVEGCADTGYRFYHWQYLDEFIYFSHNFITIPPPVWTNAAHKHGVKMLGTLITEWDDGKAICSEFLKSSRDLRSLANKMVDIMKFYGFEGWLVNIENVIQEDQVGNLRDFVAYLTERCHSEVTGSKVIWYDSVTRHGDLKWQDQLNEENRMFFEACDAIFLNYTWNETKLSDSHALAKSLNRVPDVYVGVDVFGRNCPGGGGYNTCQAMSMIKDAKLSTAVFAPGWVYETQDKEDFTANQNKFWGLLHDYCTPSVFTILDISTSFCHGSGLKYFCKGEIVKDSPWYNLSLQQIQPNVNLTGQSSQLKVKYTESDGYIGGGCLLLRKMNGSAKTDIIPFNLFQLDVKVDSPSLYVSYTYKDPKSAGVDMVISLTLTNSGHSLVLHLGQRGEEMAGGKKPRTEQEEMWIEPLGDASASKTKDNSNGWVTRCFKVSQTHLFDSRLQTVYESSLSDWRLQTVSVSLSGHDSEDPVSCLLGQIQIHQAEVKEENCVQSVTFHSLPTEDEGTEQEQTGSAPVDLTTRKDNSSKTYLIKWEDTKYDDIHHYNIYLKFKNNYMKLVRQSVTTKCTVDVDEKDGDWYIQSVSNNGSVLPKVADVHQFAGHVSF